MQILLEEVINFISALGGPVLVALILALIGILVGGKPQRAIRAGLTVGVGFIGLIMVLVNFLNTAGPVVKSLVEAIGFQLIVLDMGFAYIYPLGFGWWGFAITAAACFAFQIGILLLGYKRGGTDSIDIYDMPVFLWYSVMAYLVWVLTDNFILGLGGAMLAIWLKCRVADWTAPLAQDPEEYNFAGITWTHEFQGIAIKSLFIDKYILSKIPGLTRFKADPASLRERFGLFGDPIFIGFLIGFGLGLAAWSVGASTIPAAFVFGLNSAATMILMPRMVGLFIEGTQVVAEFLKTWTMKHMPDRSIYFGLDWAICAGNETMITAGMLLMPIAFLVALIQPGNVTLPYADLPLAMCACMFFVATSKGHVFRSLLGGFIIILISNYLAGFYAPVATWGATQLGLEVPAGLLITSWSFSWHTWIVLIPLILIYLFGGVTGRAVLEYGGLFSAESVFYFSLAYLLIDIPLYFLVKDDPVRIANTPREELYEKGMRSLEEIKKAKT